MEADLKEQVTITVDEAPEVKEEEIKDLDISLNTLEGNEASYQTEKINGKLHAFIISSENPVDVAIYTQKGIGLYSKTNYVGNYYLPVKITAVSKSGNQFNFVASSFYLNDAIMFSIRGQRNSKVDITMRYCDG